MDEERFPNEKLMVTAEIAPYLGGGVALGFLNHLFVDPKEELLSFENWLLSGFAVGAGVFITVTFIKLCLLLNKK